jgi:hypothetical protein
MSLYVCQRIYNIFFHLQLTCIVKTMQRSSPGKTLQAVKILTRIWGMLGSNMSRRRDCTETTVMVVPSKSSKFRHDAQN